MNRRKAALFALCIALAPVAARTAKAQQRETASDAAPKRQLAVAEVVSRLEERNRERAAALRKFEAMRTYRMQYRGTFGNRDAEMTVRLNYTSPDEKKFEIVSQSGTKFILEHIFKRLLQEESDAATEENRQRTALTSRNYDFNLAAFEDSPEGPQYVLNVIPKTDNKYLYRGKIWVDAKDFAVTRIEAEPAKSPSFWIKKSAINHRYQKVDNFWLPAENRTENWIRLGGYALLTIEYKNYTLTDTAPLAANGFNSPPLSPRIASEKIINSENRCRLSTLAPPKSACVDAPCPG
jgi:outer membrane lipoprotein-sorting protein